MNFDPEALDASFDRWLRLTGDYDRSDLALGESRARLATLDRESGLLRADIVSFLAAHGEAPGSETRRPGRHPPPVRPSPNRPVSKRSRARHRTRPRPTSRHRRRRCSVFAWNGWPAGSGA